MDRDIRKNERHLKERGARGSRCRYKKWGNMRCFENPIVVFDFVLCNIIYGIVE